MTTTNNSPKSPAVPQSSEGAGLNTGGSNAQRSCSEPPSDAGAASSVVDAVLRRVDDDSAKDALALRVRASNVLVFAEQVEFQVADALLVLRVGRLVTDPKQAEHFAEHIASALSDVRGWCEALIAVAEGRAAVVARAAEPKAERSALLQAPPTAAKSPGMLTEEQHLEAELRRTQAELHRMSNDLAVTTKSLGRMVEKYREQRHELERWREDDAEKHRRLDVLCDAADAGCFR